MLDYLVISPEWILKFRNSYLTPIFSLCPLLATDYFYIIVIALGYWTKPQKRLFIDLGFLVPFSTLLNCLLKNLFQIPRPEPYLHLIPMDHSFGFLSGDVQVATVFWLSIALNVKHKYLKCLCWLPVLIIALSRIYLGVHSIYDVIGGGLIGWITLYVWDIMLSKNYFQLEHNRTYKHLWMATGAIVVLYTFASKNLEQQPIVPMSIGALIGYGAALPWIKNKYTRLNQESNINNIFSILISLTITILLAKLIPVIKTTTLIFYTTCIFKYAVIVFSIYVLIPTFRHKMLQALKTKPI